MTGLRHRKGLCCGNRVATTDALGNTVFKSYDPLGNVVAEWGATYPVRYTYDSAPRRTSLSTTRDGMTWDATTWTYDPPTGNCLSKTYADGSIVTYTYTPTFGAARMPQTERPLEEVKK